MFHFEKIVDFCMSLGEVSQDFPFNNQVMVFRYRNKIFAFTDILKHAKGDTFFTLKNKPEKNIILCEDYFSINPGYHMNKKHWITLSLSEEELDDTMICELIFDSYSLVKEGMRKKE